MANKVSLGCYVNHLGTPNTNFFLPKSKRLPQQKLRNRVKSCQTHTLQRKRCKTLKFETLIALIGKLLLRSAFNLRGRCIWTQMTSQFFLCAGVIQLPTPIAEVCASLKFTKNKKVWQSHSCAMPNFLFIELRILNFINYQPLNHYI